jgi:peptidoglycan/xylan/chitin deacetylase (PgdA/CDA1 family)
MITGASIPVKYSCCKNYINNEDKSSLDFGDTYNWAIIGSNGSHIEADQLNFKEGRQGLKLVAENGSIFAAQNISYNFEKVRNFEFDLYVYNSGQYNYTKIYLTSDKKGEKYFYYTIKFVLDGWNHIVLKKSDMINHGEDWNNTMTIFMIEVSSIKGKNVSVTADNFRYDLSGRAKAIITIDDGTTGDTVAEPILTANNQKAVSFVVASWINRTGFMTINDLKRLQGSGWDISSHTISHPYLTQLDDHNLTLELNSSYDWLVNHGFQKSASFVAYPFGDYNGHVVEKAKQRYIFARGTDTGIEPHLEPEYRNNLYKLKTIEARNTTSVQSVEDEINGTIDQGWLIILLFHKIVNDTPTEFEYSKSNFQQVSDYLKSRSADIDVVTLSDYVNPNINNFTPVINKTSRIYPNGTVSLITENKYDEYMPNMTVIPASEHIDITVNTYEEGLISFNEPDLSSESEYSMGDRIPNQQYVVSIYLSDKKLLQNLMVIANSTGYINYYSTKFDNQIYTEIRPFGINDTYISKNNTILFTKNVPTNSEKNISTNATNAERPPSENNRLYSIDFVTSIIILLSAAVYLSYKRLIK